MPPAGGCEHLWHFGTWRRQAFWDWLWGQAIRQWLRIDPRVGLAETDPVTSTAATGLNGAAAAEMEQSVVPEAKAVVDAVAVGAAHHRDCSEVRWVV